MCVINVIVNVIVPSLSIFLQRSVYAYYTVIQEQELSMQWEDNIEAHSNQGIQNLQSKVRANLRNVLTCTHFFLN